MRRLRLPLLALSLLFFATALSALLWSNRGGGALIPYLHGDETPERRAARDEARRKSDKQYIDHLRADGIARVKAGDYENGRARLDEAARMDPAGEKSEDVVTARHWIAIVPLLDAGDGR